MICLPRGHRGGEPFRAAHQHLQGSGVQRNLKFVPVQQQTADVGERLIVKAAYGLGGLCRRIDLHQHMLHCFISRRRIVLHEEVEIPLIPYHGNKVQGVIPVTVDGHTWRGPNIAGVKDQLKAVAKALFRSRYAVKLQRMALNIFCQCVEIAHTIGRQSIDLQAFACCIRDADGLFRRQIRDLTCAGIHLCNVGDILPAAPHPVQRVDCIQLTTGFVISHVCKNNFVDHSLIRILLDHGFSQRHRGRRQVTAAEAIQLAIVIHGV